MHGHKNTFQGDTCAVPARHRVRLFCFVTLSVIAACLGLALRSASPAAAAREPAIHYTIVVDVDYEKAFLNVTQTVAVRNRTASPLSSLVFQATPAAPAFNAFTLSSATVSGSAVNWSQDGTVLEIPLSPALAAGEMVSVTLTWWGQVPPSNGRYGVADGVIALGNWYPQLAVLHDGAWAKHQYTAIGDAFFSEVADYDVTVNVAANVTVAATAPPLSRSGGKWVYHAEDVRDFALGLSANFATLTRKVDNVTITVYHQRANAEGAKVGLDTAERAMRWYANKLGPYPFASLAIVELPGGGEHNAQEHAGLFFIRSDFFTPLLAGEYTAHELAHAWFFAAVGNDQVRDPWVDESLVTSISMDFYRETSPREYSGLWGKWGGRPEEFTNSPVINLGINDFKAGEGGAYFWTIYRQGAMFFNLVRETLGDDAYWRALRQYYLEYKGGIARPQDLLRALRQASTNTDLVPIFRQYFDYPWLKLPNLTLEIGGADGGAVQGQLSVPITVTADSPTVTLDVLLDGAALTSAGGSTSVAIDTLALANGQHTLRAVADDHGLNRVERTRSFVVANPTPTPTTTPTLPPGVPTPTATSVATPQPSPTAPATPPPATTPAADAAAPQPADQRPALVAGVLLGIVALVALWRILSRRRRRRW